MNFSIVSGYCVLTYIYLWVLCVIKYGCGQMNYSFFIMPLFFSYCIIKWMIRVFHLSQLCFRSLRKKNHFESLFFFKELILVSYGRVKQLMITYQSRALRRCDLLLCFLWRWAEYMRLIQVGGGGVKQGEGGGGGWQTGRSRVLTQLVYYICLSLTCFLLYKGLAVSLDIVRERTFLRHLKTSIFWRK